MREKTGIVHARWADTEEQRNGHTAGQIGYQTHCLILYVNALYQLCHVMCKQESLSLSATKAMSLLCSRIRFGQIGMPNDNLISHTQVENALRISKECG